MSQTIIILIWVSWVKKSSYLSNVKSLLVSHILPNYNTIIRKCGLYLHQVL